MDASQPTVVLLGDRGPATRALVHALARDLAGRAEVVAVLEAPPSRWHLARRRARRLGWPTVVGHVAFVGAVLPVLRWTGRARSAEIVDQAELDTRPLNQPVLVPSVNDPVVVVHGTRIIASRVLEAVPAPFVNVHAGVTPRYRGVHGGYWALAEGRPDLVGTTVHLVDPGIDTGGILAQATFVPTRRDSVATYPWLHLAAGLPLLVEVVNRLLDGQSPTPVDPLPGAETSTLRWHPTAWGYLARRVRRGVR
jgi:methionyl-tRNA formyltransferase